MTNSRLSASDRQYSTTSLSALSTFSVESAMIELQRDERRHASRNSRSKKLKRYYRLQNNLLQSIDDITVELDDYKEDEVSSKRMISATRVAQFTFCVNLSLFAAKVVSAVLSGSLAVISSVIDSAMDLVAGFLMWYSNRAMVMLTRIFIRELGSQENVSQLTLSAPVDVYTFSRSYLEPVAIVVQAIMMSTSAGYVMQKCIKWIEAYAIFEARCTWSYNNLTEEFCDTEKSLINIISPCLARDSGPQVELPSILISTIVICTKITLYLLCRKSKNPTIQALTQDHRNDTLSNTCAIVFGLIGTNLWSYADSLGAMLISSYIIITWLRTAIGQIKRLTGYRAPPPLLNKLTWLILNHDERILYIDDLKAFHFGSNFLVEVYLILPGEMINQESQDICESLQIKLEKLPEVDRAHVHVDYVTGYSHHVISNL